MPVNQQHQQQRVVLGLMGPNGMLYLYGWTTSVEIIGPYCDTQITWARRPRESRVFPSDTDFEQESLNG